ncbi:MAG: hypothetical protein CVV27_03680 [Candidatus Melainabacteria bacterium HGW-Melainabacteria-1]|nr:MAG: hypothetical protein CVV27_03680 [Candidatus Melainabacteria bacterium HGW-Melainabacteria-1]
MSVASLSALLGLPLAGLLAWWLVALPTPPAEVPHTQIASASPEADKPVRFVAFGDFGTGASVQYQVAAAIKQKCEADGCDFAVTLGDNIYNDGVKSVTDPQFQSKFEKPFAQLPFRFYMSLGNHDYRGNVQAQVDYTQQSKKWTLPARYYVFDEGPVTFFALDTNLPEQKQIEFMQRNLAKAQTPWKIAFGHHPRFTNSAYKNTQSPALKKLLDLFCGQAQLYLAGHEHDKQHLKANCGIEHLIVGTGGGQRRVGTGPNTLYAGNSFGFAWIEASQQTLRFELLDTKGKVEYRYEIKRD